MNLEEFGQLARQSDLRSRYSNEQLAYVPDRVLAMKVLDAYPQYWDMISPAARRIREIINRNPEETRYLFGARVSTRIQDRAHNIANNTAELNMVHAAEQMMEASAYGVPVTHLGELKLQMFQHQSREQLMRLESWLKVQEAREIANIELFKAREMLALEGADAAQWLDIARKVARLERELEATNGRGGQKALPETSASEFGSEAETPEDE